MKKIKLLSIIILFSLFLNITNNHSAFAAPTTITNNQKAIQEVAWQYYLRGMDIQYEGQRRDQYTSPENITTQNASYMVCSGFTYAVYYETFGIEIPVNTVSINKYGNLFYGNASHPDVVYHTEDFHSLASNAGARATIAAEILPMLEIGDVLSYYTGPTSSTQSGHATLIYDFEYDNNGNRTNAIILHSNSNFDKTTNKLTKGLSWNDKTPNTITGIDEGTVQRTSLYNSASDTGIIKSARNAYYFTILRPTALSNSSYNKPICTNNGSNCSSELTPYSLTSNSIQRLTYPGIQIEKTVSKFNGSTVEPGDTITYNIDITNHSNETYAPFTITENIPTDLVSSVDSPESSTLNFAVNQLRAGSTEHISYSVKVRSDPSNVGKEIVSTGTVAGIPSATIKNRISYNLTADEQARLRQAYNLYKDDYSGAELIDQIYSFAIDQDYGLRDLILGANYNRESFSETTKLRNATCSPYFQATDANALINTFYSNSVYNISLNEENSLSQILFNNYYSALNTAYDANCQATSIYPKNWSRWLYGKEGDDRSPRQVRIYPETLQTGDILLYANTDDPVTNESGTYAFIYLNDAFYGVNYLADGQTTKNVISATNEKSADNLWTMFGKDYYAILRPSLAFQNNSSNPDTNPDINPEENPDIDPDNDSFIAPDDDPNTNPDIIPDSNTNTNTSPSSDNQPSILVPNTGTNTSTLSTTAITTTVTTITIIGIISYITRYNSKRRKSKISFKNK